MKTFEMMNEWSFSGQIFYLKELEKDYGASLKIRGSTNEDYRSGICEISCLVKKDVWDEAKKKGVAMYKDIALSGHMETFFKPNRETKTMFIAEYVMEVA